MNTEILLSDKFVEFSQKIASYHEQKKRVQTELKKIIEEHKQQLKVIEDEVTSLTTDFQAWQDEISKGK
jgi:Skp family chaperone for outer membrane proteins